MKHPSDRTGWVHGNRLFFQREYFGMTWEQVGDKLRARCIEEAKSYPKSGQVWNSSNGTRSLLIVGDDSGHGSDLGGGDVLYWCHTDKKRKFARRSEWKEWEQCAEIVDDE